MKFKIYLLLVFVSFKIIAQSNESKKWLESGILKQKYHANYQGAIADYSKAIELDSINSEAYFQRGVSKSRLEDYYGAIDDVSKTIELNPNNPKAYLFRGILRNKLTETKSAFADYTKAIELNPNEVNAFIGRGLLRKDNGDMDGFCDDIRKAEKLGGDVTKFIIYCN
jgi:tetratricopeptide (TPR) repeat protein